MCRIRKILYMTFLLGLSAQLSLAAGWASQDMDKCRDIHIDGGDQTLDYFPVPLNLEKDVDMLSDYSDLRFHGQACGNGGEKLDFEFEERDTAGVEVWIKIPQLSSTGEKISVYYDNKTSVSDVEAPTEVWDKDFNSVHHLNQEVSGNSGSFSGSTGNPIFGQTLNGVSTSSKGIFDGAYGFDGADDALNFSDNFRYSDSEPFTLRLDFNRTGSLDDNQRILGFDVNSSWGLFLDENRGNNDSDILFGYNGSILQSNISTSQNIFYSASVRYDGSQNADLFVNGVKVNSTSSVSWSIPTEDFMIASSGNAYDLNENLSFDGVLDEFRVSNTTRSDTWIKQSRDLLYDAEKISIGQEIEYVQTDILSPRTGWKNTRNIDLSVTSGENLDAFNFSLDQTENDTAGLKGVFYTNSTGHVRVIYENGNITEFGEKAALIGSQAQIDSSDRFLELPYINGNGDLKIIDRTGEVSMLDTGLSTSKTVIGVSENGSQDYVYYPDPSDNSYIKKVSAGKSPQTVGTGIASNGVLGSADFTGNGDENLVFLGTSDTIKYLDYQGNVQSTGFSSFGSNNNKGIGHVSDIKSDGQARVPYVTGSNNLALLDYQGNKINLNQNYGSAIKTRIGSSDWGGGDEKEILHQEASTGEIRIMYLNGTVESIRDKNGNPVTADDVSGLASARQHPINFTLRDLSEGNHTVEVNSYYSDIHAHDSTWFGIDVSIPQFRNFDDNTSSDFFSVNTANISVDAYDRYSGLNQVKLATNETGTFSNKTVYGSPQEFENISDEYILSNFLRKNISFIGDLGYRLWISDAVDNIIPTPKNSFEVHKTDLEATNISYNITNPIEGQKINLGVNITNIGGFNATSNITVLEERYNESSWNFVSNTTTETKLEASKVNRVNFTVDPGVGPNRYTAFIDPNNSVDEKNESNNNISNILDVPSYHLKYGGSGKSGIALGSNQKLIDWDTRGTIFYSDIEASYSIDDLRPLNESGDLVAADETLGMEGYNDSISKTYDRDQDGFADTSGCIDIAGTTRCDIPLVNSTNTSNFQTGILYDGENTGGFTGTQDIVFVTEIQEESQGLYGVYDYEIKVPAPLSSQYSPSEFVDLRVELK